MDYLGYRVDWTAEEAENPTPEVRIKAAAQQWDLAAGGHPYLDIPTEFYQRDVLADLQDADIPSEFQIRPMGCVHGHNTLADSTISSLVEIDINVPISPLFVRDLCGRVVHIGIGPEKKTARDWRSYGAHKTNKAGELVNPQLPNIVFPENCRYINTDEPYYNLIEEVFFTKFRTLAQSLDFEGTPSGEVDKTSLGYYPNANLYPYKMRLDTFYIDGYKLPQTNMVYAKSDVSAIKVHEAVEKFKAAWQNKPASQSYEAFFEANGGECWYDELFLQGCTVIPTFEACNGYNQVSTEFTLEDFWPGCAVVGLHTIVRQEAHNAPFGTIIDVLEPGYVTASTVQPAKVVISDGSGYVSPHAQNPAPLIPNFNLPHQRQAINWEGIWLPTHPGHFEAPALWGWDAATGRFLQLEGPLWDPLHYYYECMEPILQEAFKRPAEKNKWLVSVPEKMKGRFYPITQQPGFDVVSEAALERRRKRKSVPKAALTRIRDGKVYADIGYHPLPLQYEYELDTWWFPEFHPFNRTIPSISDDVRMRLAPVISCTLDRKTYIANVNGPEEAIWLRDATNMQETSGEAILDYPHLLRYSDNDTPMEVVFEQGGYSVFLEHVSDELLESVAANIFTEMNTVDNLESIGSGFYDAVCEYREKSLKLLRQRHALYRRNPGLYVYAWWRCVPVDMVEDFFTEWESKQALTQKVSQTLY